MFLFSYYNDNSVFFLNVFVVGLWFREFYEKIIGRFCVRIGNEEKMLFNLNSTTF